MILLVDVGNTNIVIGVYKDNEYIAGWRISTDSKKTSDEYGIQMIQLFHQNDLNPNSFLSLKNNSFPYLFANSRFPLKRVLI